MREDVPALIRRIAWRAIHEHGGVEVASLEEVPGGWRLRGEAATTRDGRPVRIAWTVETDAGWHTRSAKARVSGAMDRRFEIESDGRGRWTLDGADFPEADGCVDVDLGWTPATNTLPIRRFGLVPGEGGRTRVVWIVYPDLDVVVADQHYECLSESTYRYASGDFSAVLTVDEAGLVTDYEGIWRAVPPGSVRLADAP